MNVYQRFEILNTENRHDAEIYTFFWSDLHTFLLNSLNFAHRSGSFSITQGQCVITCLPKDSKQKSVYKKKLATDFSFKCRL